LVTFAKSYARKPMWVFFSKHGVVQWFKWCPFDYVIAAVGVWSELQRPRWRRKHGDARGCCCRTHWYMRLRCSARYDVYRIHRRERL